MVYQRRRVRKRPGWPMHAISTGGLWYGRSGKMKPQDNRLPFQRAGSVPWQCFHLRPLPQVHGSLRPRWASCLA